MCLTCRYNDVLTHVKRSGLTLHSYHHLLKNKYMYHVTYKYKIDIVPPPPQIKKITDSTI